MPAPDIIRAADGPPIQRLCGDLHRLASGGRRRPHCQSYVVRCFCSEHGAALLYTGAGFHKKEIRRRFPLVQTYFKQQLFQTTLAKN
uniref:Uncharacterized protein n=1 Tax=Arundo donax TaxID=35708 RepID=A0A0A8YYJ2_ARUDO